jgi:hypothetical protein
MILVSISSTEEKLVILVKHRIEYLLESKYRKSIKKRNLYVFALLFLSFVVLMSKEIFMRFHE